MTNRLPARPAGNYQSFARLPLSPVVHERHFLHRRILRLRRNRRSTGHREQCHRTGHDRTHAVLVRYSLHLPGSRNSASTGDQNAQVRALVDIGPVIPEAWPKRQAATATTGPYDISRIGSHLNTRRLATAKENTDFHLPVRRIANRYARIVLRARAGRTRRKAAVAGRHDYAARGECPRANLKPDRSEHNTIEHGYLLCSVPFQLPTRTRFKWRPRVL